MKQQVLSVWAVGILVIVLFCIPSSSGATPVLWDAGAGGNGHYYEFIDKEAHVDWGIAKTEAEGLSYNNIHGHLATVTSAEENDFVSSTAVWMDQTTSVWLGATYSGVWNWVTGEQWVYTNWDPWLSQPDNQVPGNDFLLLYESTPNKSKWGDAYTEFGDMTGYIVEFDTNAAPVPEPATMLLLGTGIAGLAGTRLRRKTIND